MRVLDACGVAVWGGLLGVKIIMLSIIICIRENDGMQKNDHDDKAVAVVL